MSYLYLLITYYYYYLILILLIIYYIIRIKNLVFLNYKSIYIFEYLWIFPQWPDYNGQNLNHKVSNLTLLVNFEQFEVSLIYVFHIAFLLQIHINSGCILYHSPEFKIIIFLILLGLNCLFSIQVSMFINCYYSL